MDKWRDFFGSSGVDIWTIIEEALIVAHTDYPDELRQRRDAFTELMYAPHYAAHSKSSDAGVLPKGSDKTNAMSGVYKTEQADDEEDDQEGEEHQDEEEHGVRGISDDDAQYELVHLDSSDDEEGEVAPATELGHHDTFDDEVEALNDEIEREELLLKDINSIKDSIKDINQPEAEVMDLLYRIKQLNISVDALKATNIGKSVNVYRKHPSRAVRAKTKEIVRSWKDLVDEWMRSMPEVSASANEECVAMGDEEVGLPSPPLDEGGLLAARTVEMTEIFNFTDDDLSAGSGPSPPTSDGLSDFGTLPHRKTMYDRSDHPLIGRHSSSPDQEHDVHGPKGVARVLKVDKHRAISVESKFNQNPRNAVGSSGSIRKGVAVASGSKLSTGMTSNTGSRRPAGGSSSTLLKQNSDGGVRKSDAQLIPSRSRVETLTPDLSTKCKSSTSEVTENEKLEASKRRLHSNYMMHEKAKKQRTVQQLDLTELPKGGPKAQRPGQNRGWVNGRK